MAVGVPGLNERAGNIVDHASRAAGSDGRAEIAADIAVAIVGGVEFACRSRSAAIESSQFGM